MSNAGRILVVEDAEIERKAICNLLRLHGHTVYPSEGVDKALGYLHEGIDVVLCDIHLGDLSGLDLMSLWKKQRPRTRFILITGQSSISDAVEAIKAGAFDYLTKPMPHDKLTLLVRHTIDAVRQEEQDSEAARAAVGMEELVGSSPPMNKVLARIRRAAPIDSTVLIQGENGTGKELAAQALHRHSQRRKMPLVAVNVAAVPATLVESELFGHVRGAFTGATERRIGRFEQADGGTLFIDEIGDFDAVLQPKLLRVLETRTLTPVGGQEDIKVNVRIIAATSRDLAQMVRDGKFREDLYYRLNVVSIHIPPLRERPQDIGPLVDHFVNQIAAQKQPVGRRFAPDVVQRLLGYPWPGNVRELRNTLESMMVLADGPTMTEADLPDHITHLADAAAGGPQRISVGLTMEELEKLAIVRALESCGQNRTHAAQRLGISVRTLQRKLRGYDINAAAGGVEGDIVSRT
jgi:two-component system, NtrC family, response regulator HydG